jgi:hypothetical protein
MSNAGLLILTAILTLAAVAVGVLFGAEVLRVLRDLFARPSGKGQFAGEPDMGSQTTARTGEKSRRSRATVERLITHFEDKDSRSMPGSKET